MISVRIVAAPGSYPSYQSPGAAGADLRADLESPVVLKPGERCLVPTGVSMALPPGMEGQVRPRSGLAVRNGITILNAPGTIDSDYRGEIQVPVINLGMQPFTLEPGMRIAQIVIAPVVRADFQPVSELEHTPRGSGGFGSTGTA